MYIIKVGSLYVGQDGQLVNGQKDAIRIDSTDTFTLKPRAVILTSKRYNADARD